jgi:hypothetical protein
MTVKIVILMKKKPGMSREDFIHHYETVHAVEFGKKLLGHLFARYVRNYPKRLVEYQPEDPCLEGNYDAVTEIWVKDDTALAEMQRIINLPENNKRILEDEEKFQDRLQTRLLIVEEIEDGTTL